MSSSSVIKPIGYTFFFSLIIFYLLKILSLTLYGIDFSDEGRHLNEIQYAFTYDWSASQYGAVIHPIAEVFDYNIPALRIFNIGITFILCFLVVWIQIVKSKKASLRTNFFNYASCISFGLLGLSFFNVWLPTPSYYSLTFQSLLVYWISFKYLDVEKHSNLRFYKIVPLSLASSLVFLSKPSSFLVIFLISLTVIGIFAKNRIFSIAVYNLTIIVILPSISWLIFGHPFRIIERVLTASRFMSIQDPLYKLENVFRIDPFPFSWNLLLLVFSFTIVIARLVATFSTSRRNSGTLTLFIHFSAIFLLIYIFVVNYDFNSNPIILLISSLTMSLSLLCIFSRNRQMIFARVLNPNLGLLLLPFAYAVGSNGNLWVASLQAIFFIVLYGWELVQSIENARFSQISQIVILVISLPIGVLSIDYGVSNPYRQMNSIPSQVSNTVQDRNLGGVQINKETANDLQQMYSVASNVGFKSGQPILDLTGQSPLAIFVLDAYPVGSPWMVGGYTGSNALAKEVLKEVSCEILISSWLLIEPSGPRELNVDVVLNSFGSNLNDYSKVGSWYTPKGAGGYSEKRLQKLYKPLKLYSDDRRKTCGDRVG